MDKQGRVLVVDDMEQWREALVEILERDGYYVDSVPTAAQALAQIEESFYHVMVLDIRMKETDQGNIDGIGILRELDKRNLSDATKVIMLSAHGTTDLMRTAFREYKVADFLSKEQFSSKVFLENMRRVFLEEVNVNLSLSIHWQRVNEPEQAVLNLPVNGTRVKRGTPLQDMIVAELQDLLRRLFFQAESILVRPLASGQSGTTVLWVQPFYATGGGRAVIVKFGNSPTIAEEYHNFKEYVEPFIGGGRNTTILSVRYTSHLAGIVYSLLGASNDQLEDFGVFYHRADVAQIADGLDRLFLDTCSAWYASPGKLEPHNLTEDYQTLLGFTYEKLEQAFTEQLKAVQGKRELYFSTLKNKERTFTNPLLATANAVLVRPTYVCITHGDFNQHNILVDSMRNMWLIDFQGTGKGHILRDIAKLDSEVRFQLLAPEKATLEERLDMEEALCSVERFSQVEHLLDRFSTKNSALAKAYSTVVHLRLLAGKLVSQNRSDDISEYYIALLYYALNTLRFYAIPVPLKEHAILSASFLVDCLGLRA